MRGDRANARSEKTAGFRAARLIARLNIRAIAHDNEHQKGRLTMKIGIISDTHGIFRKDWLDAIDQCDCIIHAGDFDCASCYEQFKNLGKPLYPVRGNCDDGSWADFLPELLTVPIDGKIFYIAHNKYDLPENLSEADFIISGHTHRYEYCERGGKPFINPGSAAEPRDGIGSMAVLELAGDDYSVQRVFL